MRKLEIFLHSNMCEEQELECPNSFLFIDLPPAGPSLSTSLCLIGNLIKQLPPFNKRQKISHKPTCSTSSSLRLLIKKDSITKGLLFNNFTTDTTWEVFYSLARQTDQTACRLDSILRKDFVCHFVQGFLLLLPNRVFSYLNKWRGNCEQVIPEARIIDSIRRYEFVRDRCTFHILLPLGG